MFTISIQSFSQLNETVFLVLQLDNLKNKRMAYFYIIVRPPHFESVMGGGECRDD